MHQLNETSDLVGAVSVCFALLISAKRENYGKGLITTCVSDANHDDCSCIEEVGHQKGSEEVWLLFPALLDPTAVFGDQSCRNFKCEWFRPRTWTWFQTMVRPQCIKHTPQRPAFGGSVFFFLSPREGLCLPPYFFSLPWLYRTILTPFATSHPFPVTFVLGL